MSTLQDFSFSTYSCDINYFLNKLYEKRPEENFKITPRETDCLFNVFISEFDTSKNENIFFTGKQIKSKHYDLKNGIFVFAGVIHETDVETINLIKNTMRNKTYNQFIKNIVITHGVMKDEDEINVVREFSFKGFVCEFLEYYDRFGNFNFEFVICKRKVMYRDDILIKRLDNGLLLIGKVEKPAKITIPIAKSKKSYTQKLKKGKLKNLQVGNTFWAIGGICLAVLGVAGTVATGGTAAIAITVLFGANTIVSNSYSIYLDYNDRDDEMDLDTLYNNPLKFSIGELLAQKDESRREVGHVIYHGLEIFLGIKGLQGMAKGFKIKSLFKTRNISASHKILGELQGKEKVVNLEKVLFNGYQVVDGVNGVQNNVKGFNKAIKEYEPPTYKPTLKLKEGGI